jgi:hypothetical protein
MTEKWRQVRMKKEQLDRLDGLMPGIPRWKQVDNLWNTSLGVIGGRLFGTTDFERPKKKFGKRGELSNILFMGLFMFAIAIVILVCFYTFTQINAGFQASDTLTPQAKAASQGVIDKYPGFMDWTLLFVMVGLFIVALVSSLIIIMHPALAILYFIGLVIVTFVMAVLSNAFQEVAATPEFATSMASLPIINSVMGWLPVFVFFFGLACMAVMFKLRSVMMT